MKKTIASVLAIICTTAAFAQSISPGQISDIRASFAKDPSTVAARNALCSTSDIASLAVCADAIGKIDDNFKYEVKRLPSAPDQKTSGRCWLFSSLNGLRQTAADYFDVKDFRFSNVYNYFWDLFEKSNLFLENIISTASRDADDREVAFYFKTPVGDGGVWNFFEALAGKYGVVPESAMPETAHSLNSANMRSVLNLKLRREAWAIREAAAAGATIEQLRERKIEVLKDVYRILALCLGEPPTEFTWRYADKKGQWHTITSTPEDFYRSFVPADYNLNDRLMVMSDPTRPYYRRYDVTGYRDVIEGESWVYLNLPIEEVKVACLSSIKSSEPVYISCDWRKEMRVVGNKATMDFANYDYEALFGIDLRMDQRTMILSRYTSSAHAMLIIACDTDENDRPLKWKLFNSYMNGGIPETLIMTDEWFDNYMYRFILPGKFLSAKAVEAASSEIVPLPVWDYMR